MYYKSLFLIFAAALNVVTYVNHKSKLNKVDDVLDKAAMNATKLTYKEKMDTANSVYKEAKKDADVIFKKEKDLINELKSESNLYHEAKNRFVEAKAKRDAAKKALSGFKSSESSVSVGSGDNKISVSLKDESQKILLEQNLKEAELEFKKWEHIFDREKERINIEAKRSRTADEREIISTYEKAGHNKYLVESNMDKCYRESLRDARNDKDIYSAAYKKVFTKVDIIIESCIFSILPVMALAYIWTKAVKNIKLL